MFFAAAQNKMHYAVHGNTAAEVIVERADYNKEYMGLNLSVDEMQELNEIVTMYLDYATRQAWRHIPMTIKE